MAPPTRLRPHLNDLLQKNHELEHVVADLRHQLTQSFAKWADERKTLATGCDALMASFAKFRARLDAHPSDMGDSEGEVEQNLDALGSNEDENANGETEADQTLDDLRERCHALAAELQLKEGELEESRRKHEETERSYDEQTKQLRAALEGADISTQEHPERPSDDSPPPADASRTELEDALRQLSSANEEVTKLKSLLQQWKKYGNDWKREAQTAQTRINDLQARETHLDTQIKENAALLETEKEEVRKLTSELADKATEVEKQRSESLKRVHDLEATVAFLRARLSPEQLASFDQVQTQTGPEPTLRTDVDPNKRSEMIVLKIPYRWRPLVENGGDDRQNQTPASSSISMSPAPQTSTPPSFNAIDYEVCIHTCSSLPCRNDSQSFLWPRKQASLPRHALSSKKHRHCAPECPGHRLLMMPLTEGLKEPRATKCRPPSETELAAAREEVKKLAASEQIAKQGVEAEETRRERSAEDEPGEDADKPHEEASSSEGTSGSVSEDELGDEENSQKADEEEKSRKTGVEKELQEVREKERTPEAVEEGTSQKAGEDDTSWGVGEEKGSEEVGEGKVSRKTNDEELQKTDEDGTPRKTASNLGKRRSRATDGEDVQHSRKLRRSRIIHNSRP